MSDKTKLPQRTRPNQGDLVNSGSIGQGQAWKRAATTERAPLAERLQGALDRFNAVLDRNDEAGGEALELPAPLVPNARARAALDRMLAAPPPPLEAPSSAELDALDEELRALSSGTRCDSDPVPSTAARAKPSKVVNGGPPKASTPKPKGLPCGRKSAREKQEARDLKHQRTWLEPYIDKNARERNQLVPPPNTKPIAYYAGQEVFGDPRGTGARKWLRLLRQHPNHGNMGVMLDALRDAALEPIPGKPGHFRYDYSDTQARRIVAQGVILILSARRRRRSGKLTLCVMGMSIDCLRGCLHAPGDSERRAGRNTIGGGGRKSALLRRAAAAARWPDRTLTDAPSRARPDGQRLRDAGFFYAEQPKIEEAEEWERSWHMGADGIWREDTIQRYWLANAPADSSADWAAVNERGLAWADEKISAVHGRREIWDRLRSPDTASGVPPPG